MQHHVRRALHHGAAEPPPHVRRAPYRRAFPAILRRNARPGGTAMSTFTNPLKLRLNEPDPLYGLWLSLGSASAAEALAHAGFDWLLIDMEHSPNDSVDVTEQLRAIAPAHLPSEPVVRVPAAEPWIVKRVLDAGARTLMFPNIESAEEAAYAVRLT